MQERLSTLGDDLEVQVNIRLTELERNHLIHYCKLKDVTYSALVRQFIRQLSLTDRLEPLVPCSMDAIKSHESDVIVKAVNSLSNKVLKLVDHLEFAERAIQLKDEEVANFKQQLANTYTVLDTQGELVKTIANSYQEMASRNLKLLELNDGLIQRVGELVDAIKKTPSAKARQWTALIEMLNSIPDLKFAPMDDNSGQWAYQYRNDWTGGYESFEDALVDCLKEHLGYVTGITI